MPSIADLLTTTILIPTGGSFNDLEETTIDTAINEHNKKNLPAVLGNQFEISITSYCTDSSDSTKTTKQTSRVGLCQVVLGLSVRRDIKTVRSGGSPLYEVKVPDMIDYGEVTLRHLYTNSTAFLDWLVNGATEGGAMMADVEIKIGDKKNGYGVFTLRDAFPIKWTLGDIMVINVDEVQKRKAYAAGDGSIPLEEIVLVYGKMDFSKEEGK